MIDNQTKKELKELMDSLGIRAQVRVWQFIKDNPDANRFQVDEVIDKLLADQTAELANHVVLRDTPLPYKIFGKNLIEPAALEDMDSIALLPYMKKLVISADGHRVKKGHVPVGTVALTTDCILPGVVGSDIACSVYFTVLETIADWTFWPKWKDAFQYILAQYTYFGQTYSEMATKQEGRLEDPLFDEVTHPSKIIALHASLHHQESKDLLTYRLLGAAHNQFGTSGDGNHFASIGYSDNKPVTAVGYSETRLRGSENNQLALLSHFGSRSVGSDIAKFFIAKANELNPMPKGQEDNAPLYFDTDQWAEDYFKLMEWAGLFAKNSHAYLHKRLIEEMAARGICGAKEKTFSIYTRHNYAWATPDGIVHRKGATPAPVAEYAMIPATMGHPSQIVIGLGNEESLNSASHGAGRKMSRSVALQHIHGVTAETVLKDYGVYLQGGGNDEHPDAYKSIRDVMDAQKDIVKSVGIFQAVHVRMADERVSPRKRK